jgi:hypothetical protein
MEGFVYVRNVTLAELEFVRPLESVAVTVTVLAPAVNTLEVTFEPVAMNAPVTE